MQRFPDERAAISAGKLASQTSVRLRAHNAVALRLAIAAAGLNVVQPRVRPHAIHRVLKQLAPALNPATPEFAAINAVLIRTPRSLGIFAARNPDWVAEQIAAATDP